MDLSSDRTARRPSTMWAALATLPLITCILGTRDSYGVVEPKLWNEDLWTFLFEQRELGIQSFLVPYAGYFHLFPRLWALFADWLPLYYTPWIYAIGSLVAWLWVSLILVRSSLFPTPTWGAIAALMIALMPQNTEVVLILTNSQWILAVGLVVLLANPVTQQVRVDDRVFAIVSGLSGPFSVFLLPFAVCRAWRAAHRRRVRDVLSMIVVACGLIQLVALITTSQRVKSVASATVGRLAYSLTYAAAGMLVPNPSSYFALLMWPAFVAIVLALSAAVIGRVRENGSRVWLLAGGLLIGIPGIAAWAEPLPPSVQLAGGRYIFVPCALVCVLLVHMLSYAPKTTIWAAVPCVVLILFVGCSSRYWRHRAEPIGTRAWLDYCRRLDEGRSTIVRASPEKRIMVELSP